MSHQPKLPELQFLHETKFLIEFGWSSKATVGLCHKENGPIYINLAVALAMEAIKLAYNYREPNRSDKMARQYAERRLKQLDRRKIDAIMRAILGHSHIAKEFQSLREIKFLLTNGYKIVFRWIDRQEWSLLDNKKRLIVINLPLIITETFIHEMGHAVYPNKSEVAIARYEQNRLRELTARQIHIIARAVTKHHRQIRHCCPFKRLLREEHLSARQ